MKKSKFAQSTENKKRYVYKANNWEYEIFCEDIAKFCRENKLDIKNAKLLK